MPPLAKFRAVWTGARDAKIHWKFSFTHFQFKNIRTFISGSHQSNFFRCQWSKTQSQKPFRQFHVLWIVVVHSFRTRTIISSTCACSVTATVLLTCSLGKVFQTWAAVWLRWPLSRGKCFPGGSRAGSGCDWSCSPPRRRQIQRKAPTQEEWPRPFELQQSAAQCCSS